MTKALLTKEWLKTRRAFWCCVVLTAFFTCYALLGINRVIATHGVEHVWLIMLMKDQTFIDPVKYVPLLCGVLIGLAQMMPEMQHNRLKLTLHLPCGSLNLLMTMLAVGAALLTALFLVQVAVIWIFYIRIITAEMTRHVLTSSIPWFMAGYTAYFFCTAFCLEGTWKRRIMLALIGAGTVTVYFLQPMPGAYYAMSWAAILLTMSLALLSYNSIHRFKQGLID